MSEINSTVRVRRRENPFTQIDRKLINDRRLDLDTRMMLVWLLDKPPGWKTSISSLIKQLPAGRTVIERMMKEAQSLGYIRRTESRHKGKFVYEYEVFEQPDEGEFTEPLQVFRGGSPAAVHPRRLTCNDNNTKYSNTDQNDTDLRERETHARTHEPSISQSSASEPKPKAKTVRAIRQGKETITFSTPIPLEKEPSPPVPPVPLPPAFDPVAPITQDAFTAKAQPEQSEAQKVFGEYFPGKALSKRQWQLIAEQVTDIPKWIRVCQRWSEVYTDWRNFGLLDWYREGIPGVDNDRPTSGNFKGARKSEGESVSRPVAEFNYWEWQEDIKNGKYAHEPY